MDPFYFDLDPIRENTFYFFSTKIIFPLKIIWLVICERIILLMDPYSVPYPLSRDRNETDPARSSTLVVLFVFHSVMKK